MRPRRESGDFLGELGWERPGEATNASTFHQDEEFSPPNVGKHAGFMGFALGFEWGLASKQGPGVAFPEIFSVDVPTGESYHPGIRRPNTL